MKKKDGGFPYDETPMVHAFPGNADDCFDMVNQYGTYEIQRTADTADEAQVRLFGAGQLTPVSCGFPRLFCLSF